MQNPRKMDMGGDILKGGRDRPLTAKQVMWIREYLISLNATDAAVKAGYSEKSANRIGAENLSKLSFEIKKAMEEKETKLIATADEVLNFLTSTLRGEITEEVVVTEGIGNGFSKARVMNKQVSMKERMKAAELLGKRYMMFTEKHEHNIAPMVIFSGVDELED